MKSWAIDVKKQLLVLLAAFTLLLPGCSALLERDYSSVTPHNAVPATEGDPSTLRADSYQELVNALIYFVSGGMEEGTIRLYVDAENVEVFLDNACLEVVQEDPLGAYCVEFIKYTVDPVVTYSQADIQITYRRTREQVASIVQATGVTAIRSELESALSHFASERVLRISYFEEDEAYIQDLVRQAYYDVPTCALGMPTIAVHIYPKSGRQRIVEILLDYPLELEQMEERRDDLAWELQLLSRDLTGSGQIPQVTDVAEALLKEGQYDPEGGATPYEFFDTGTANSEGLSLAFAALCQKLDLPCHVIQGTRDNIPHCWNMIQTSKGWCHLDLSFMDGEDGPLYTDSFFQELGYLWETDSSSSSSGG